MMPPELAGRLRGLRLPEPDFWWPPAPGWWGLGLLLLLFAVLLFLRRRRRRALVRAARAELARIRQQVQGGGESRRLIMEVEMLLRRVALAHLPRRRVAALHGEAWLDCLDRLGGGGGAFRRGAGRLLLEAPWRADDADPEPLLALVERWLERLP